MAEYKRYNAMKKYIVTETSFHDSNATDSFRMKITEANLF